MPVSPAPEHEPERELEAERRSLADERSFIEGERKLLEAERRLLEAERRSIEEGYERMRRLFTQAPMSIAIYQGPEHRIEFANPTYLRVRGRSDEVIGRPYREVFPETQGAGRVLDDAFRTGESQVTPEARVVLDRGRGPEEAFFHVSVVALKNARGEVERVMSVSFEVTDRVLARRALDAERAKLRTVFEQAPFPIGVFEGPEHRIVLANSKWERLSGRSLPAGARLADAIPELVAQGILPLHDRAYAGETIVMQEVPLRLELNRLEQAHFFHVVLQPLRSESGAIYGHVTMALDVTEQVVARTELDSARVKAEAASRAKDDFLAMLGHELRNPLAPIMTALNLMDLRGVSGAERELSVINRQVSHLARLVDDLLDVSRITRGKIELGKEPIEIAEIIGRALETASPLFEQRNQFVHITVPRRGLVVAADAARMAQAFSNLLTNAAKYTDSGGHISVSAERSGAGEQAEIVVKFSDDGMGIRQDMLGEIFELFVQERQALDRARGGLGLGLAIVKSVITIHGGSIAADSGGSGKGSVFTVRLPASSLLPKAQEQVRAREGVPRPNPNARRILLVDDNVDAADLLATSLAATGHEVRTAYDGPSALLTLSEFEPDVALLDIGLPAMDGYELASRIHASNAKIRLVALTGYGQESDRERTRAAGFHAHLVKPVELVSVLSAISRSEPEG